VNSAVKLFIRLKVDILLHQILQAQHGSFRMRARVGRRPWIFDSNHIDRRLRNLVFRIGILPSCGTFGEILILPVVDGTWLLAVVFLFLLFLRRSQYELVEVSLHNHVLDTLHGLVQQVGVRGIGIVDIDFSVLAPDEILEPFRKELGSGLGILLRSGVIREEIDNI